MTRLGETPVLDVSDASLFGYGPIGQVSVAIADWTYDGRDNSEALRKRAIRRVGGSRGTIVRRWRYYDTPALTVLVTDPASDVWDRVRELGL
jgi:hypothetical protein